MVCPTRNRKLRRRLVAKPAGFCTYQLLTFRDSHVPTQFTDQRQFRHAAVNVKLLCAHMHAVLSVILTLISFLWPPYGKWQAIIFLPCGFFLSSFFLA